MPAWGAIRSVRLRLSSASWSEASALRMAKLADFTPSEALVRFALAVRYEASLWSKSA